MHYIMLGYLLLLLHDIIDVHIMLLSKKGASIAIGKNPDE